jgi:hypothetical protein
MKPHQRGVPDGLQDVGQDLHGHMISALTLRRRSADATRIPLDLEEGFACRFQ